MKNYKEEIIYKIRDATGWEVSLETAEYISVHMLSLFREIAKEALPKEMVPNVQCDIPSLDRCAGFNQARSEILSNIKKVIGGEK